MADETMHHVKRPVLLSLIAAFLILLSVFLVIHNLSHHHLFLTRMGIIHSTLAIFVTLGLFVFFWLYFARMENRLTEKHRKLTREVEQRQLAERRFRLIAETSNDIIFQINNQGILTYVSPAIATELGYKVEDAEGCHFKDFVVDEDLVLAEETFARVMKGRRVDLLQLNTKHIQGHSVPMELSITPLKQAKKPVGCQGISRNITERKQSEAALIRAKDEAERASMVKSDFLANMSHEIRTPMNAIIGMTNLALEEEIPSKVEEYLKVVKSSGSILLGVINDILDFSKIESGKLDIEEIRFSLHDILANLLAMFQERAREKGLQLKISAADNVPDGLIGDPLRVGQILVNLVGNAVKFTDQGEVRVDVSCLRTNADQGTLLFSIVDTGIGISLEKQASLFQAFTQADSSISRNYGGSGLGLTICRKLITLMDGDIRVRSTPGQGSVFSFNLPVKLQAVEAVQEATPLAGKKILLVDDDTQVIELLSDMLTVNGFKTLKACLPSQAINKLKTAFDAAEPVDLVLMDFMMPEMDGISTVKTIREVPEFAGLPVIMITGLGAGLEEQRARQVGIDAFLYKPISMELLMDTIGKVLTPEASKAQTGQLQSSDNEELHGLKILLVEDNHFNQVLAKEVLKKKGVVVLTANNGQEAVEMVNQSIDGVLMDIQMPVLDGLQATRRIRQREELAGLPIIAMTANALTGDRQKCLAAGMDDYVTKPFQPEEIFRVLHRQILDRSGRGEETWEAVPDKTCCSEPLGIDPDCVRHHFRVTFGMQPDSIEQMINSARRALILELEKCNEGFRAGDLDMTCRAAHAIKGVLRNLNAEKLANLAERIEQQKVRENDIEQKVPALHSMHQALEDALTPFVQEAIPSSN